MKSMKNTYKPKKERYTFILEEEVVQKAKEILERNGGKLSPVVNTVLKNWIKEQSVGAI